MPPVTVIAIYHLLMRGDILICTNTEGPSRDRAPSFYILIIQLRTFMVKNTTHTQTSIYLHLLKLKKIPLGGFYASDFNK